MPTCPPEVTRAARVKLREASVTLVGHSMGTMVINLLVEAFPHLSYRDIVFFSGAATINQTKAALDPLLREGKGNVRFYNLMLHPMNDAREINGVGVVPSGSLLVWIDDMLEHPDTLLDRTVGQWTNMRGGSSRLRFVRTKGRGQACGAMWRAGAPSRRRPLVGRGTPSACRDLLFRCCRDVRKASVNTFLKG